MVTQLLDGAELLKLSLEELDYLRADHPAEAWFSERLAAGVKVILITDGPNDIVLKGVGIVQRIAPPSVDAVDATAGGDAFIGGLLAELSAHGINENWQSDGDFLQRAVDTACRCCAHVVTRPGAYTALPTREDIAIR